MELLLHTTHNILTFISLRYRNIFIWDVNMRIVILLNDSKGFQKGLRNTNIFISKSTTKCVLLIMQYGPLFYQYLQIMQVLQKI